MTARRPAHRPANHAAHRRGLAMVFAIVVMGLAGMTLTVLASRALLQQRRTVTSIEDAQAAALLAAGVRFAEAQAATPADGAVPTPIGTLRLAWSGDASRRTCAVDAEYGHARRTVTVRFEGARAVGVSR